MYSDFKNVISKLTDEELIKVVSINRQIYQPLAVEVAENEILNRNINKKTTNHKRRYYTIKVNLLTRFINFVIDTIAIIIEAIIIFVIFGRSFGLLFYFDKDITIIITMLILLLASFFSYYVFMESTYQKTIGKFITKTKVVKSDGTKPELWNIIKRTFYRLILFDRISFLFTQNGLHDRLSNTVIIKDENLQ